MKKLMLMAALIMIVITVKAKEASSQQELVSVAPPNQITTEQRSIDTLTTHMVFVIDNQNIPVTVVYITGGMIPTSRSYAYGKIDITENMDEINACFDRNDVLQNVVRHENAVQKLKEKIGFVSNDPFHEPLFWSGSYFGAFITLLVIYVIGIFKEVKNKKTKKN